MQHKKAPDQQRGQGAGLSIGLVYTPSGGLGGLMPGTPEPDGRQMPSKPPGSLRWYRLPGAVVIHIFNERQGQRLLLARAANQC